MQNRFNKIFLYIFSISIVYFLLFAAFYIVCFIDNNGLYKMIMVNQTYKNLPFTITTTDLKNLASELMKYISGNLPFLETSVTINDVAREFYSLRTKIHMADVRNIIVTLKYVSYFSIAICIFSLFKVSRLHDSLKLLKASYIKTLIVIGILLLAILIYASINFDTFFTKFHEVLFTNDLWLLDPSEDYIICLLPQNIFMTYGIRIIVAMFISLTIPYLLLHILLEIQLRQGAR